MTADAERLRTALSECVDALVQIEGSRGGPCGIEPWRTQQIAAMVELRRLIAQGRAALSVAGCSNG